MTYNCQLRYNNCLLFVRYQLPQSSQFTASNPPPSYASISGWLNHLYRLSDALDFSNHFNFCFQDEDDAFNKIIMEFLKRILFAGPRLSGAFPFLSQEILKVNCCVTTTEGFIQVFPLLVLQLLNRCLQQAQRVVGCRQIDWLLCI